VGAAIREWTDAHASTLAAFDDLPIFVLRHETLVAEPDISPLLDFLGLDDGEPFEGMLDWIAGRSAELEAGRAEQATGPTPETDSRLQRAGHEIGLQLRRPPGRRLTPIERWRVGRAGHQQLSASLTAAAAAEGRLL
jgi:hypothetical protein